MADNQTSLGRAAEEMAVKLLKKRGYKIIERNYRSSLGEIDIIARDGKTLTFIEVKARSGDLFGPPQEAVDLRKQIKLSKVAMDYIIKMGIEGQPMRFDVVAITGDKAELIKNAFEIRE